MARKKKVDNDPIEEITDTQTDAPATEENVTVEPNKTNEKDASDASDATTKAADASPFVTTADVLSTLGKGETATIIPITDPNTKLSKITIFDGIEDADDPMTYRIPDDEDVILKGRGEFYDDPDAFDLMSWVPKPEDIYFTEKDGMIVASYLSRMFNVPEDRQLLQYIIAKKHYKERIPDMLQHINYFISHYDHDKEYLVSTLSVKNFIDRHPGMKQKAFCKMMMNRVITDTLVNKVKLMAFNLYKLNINTDKDGKYKTTPKITNDHARMIVAVSFCIRLVLPICIHFSNTNATFINKRDYIDCFDRLFLKIVEKFEKDDIEIWNPICRFVAYRVERSHTSDAIIWEKKKQLYGTTLDLYLTTLIHEVILVKSLHKLAYNRSLVSFIDGIISNSYTHYRYENFKYKPVEIEVEDSDSDDYMSHQEALEMQVSRIDESNQIINETNSKQVMNEIRMRFRIDVTQEEIDFYFDRVKFNSLTQFMLHSFFSKYFNDTNAIRLLDRRSSVELLIYMKKYLQLRGMMILPQICTARVSGKFKDTCIKNAKFIEKFASSSVYHNIISKKYHFVSELGLKEDPIVKNLSTMVNSTFELVDPDPEINGKICDNFNTDMLVSDYMLFLSIC